MDTFKECVIIPYAMFKSCNFSKNSDNDQFNVKRQRELMQERMFNKEPYSVLTSFPSKTTSPLVSGLPNLDVSPKLSISKILGEITVSQKPYAQSILDKLIKHSITWDENGEISLKGTIVKGSNIIDIMKFFTRTKLYKNEPLGLDEVWEFLQNINVPKSWFRNKPKSYREVSLGNYPLLPSKYPLEESEKQAISDTISKSLLDSSDDTGEKLDYAGVVKLKGDSKKKDSVKKYGGVDIGKVEEKQPKMFSSEISEPDPEFISSSDKLQDDIFDKIHRKKKKAKLRKVSTPSKGESIKAKSKQEKSRFGRQIKRTEKWESLNW